MKRRAFLKNAGVVGAVSVVGAGALIAEPIEWGESVDQATSNEPDIEGFLDEYIDHNLQMGWEQWVSGTLMI